jgi:YbgC/YbaW family acyl-CoA thioester hydrolase
MQRQDFRMMHRLRVRWAEVDMQKIVFNGHYLMYFDTAMADYWRALAIPYEQAMHQLGGDLYVKKASVEYFASARYDDLLDIGLTCSRLGNSSLTFTGGIFAGDKLLVSGELVYVYANPATQTSQHLPPALRALLERYEAGDVMTRIEIGDWQKLGPDASSIRKQVFVQEQGIPEADEWDARDATALHAVVYNHLDMPLATGRLLAASTDYPPRTGMVGRMAALRVLRGSGLGRQVLDKLVQRARQQGNSQVVLHAQASAAHFYAQSGFVQRGDLFSEVDIPHVEMVLAL